MQRTPTFLSNHIGVATHMSTFEFPGLEADLRVHTIYAVLDGLCEKLNRSEPAVSLEASQRKRFLIFARAQLALGSQHRSNCGVLVDSKIRPEAR